MNRYSGYLQLKPINGIIIISSQQNIIIKDYVENKLKGKMILSANENIHGGNSMILNSLINEKNSIKGIVMLSSFCLPDNNSIRKRILKNFKQQKKELHLILEETFFTFRHFNEDIEKIEELRLFQNNHFCKIYNKNNSLNLIKFFKNSWSFS